MKALVVISDLHIGCQLGLCPPEPIALDEGGTYTASLFQRHVWDRWCQFWNEWVPSVTDGMPYGVLLNGDAVEGVHHKATTPISQNLSDQTRLVETILRPRVEGHPLYWVRGTDAHAGISGSDEERLARALGAVPDERGMHSRPELWIRVGEGLVHAMHHIGTTSSNRHEASAVNAELSAEFEEAARWREEPPNVVVRSHRHRNIQVSVPTAGGPYGIAFVTAAWQGKTPFVYRTGGRNSPPQIGGSVIIQGTHDVYARHMVWTIGRPKVEVMEVME